MAHDSSEGPKHPPERGITTLEQRLDGASGAPSANSGGRYLLMVQGATPGRLCRIVAETSVIGRGEGVDIYLDDASVSTQHAKIVAQGDECWVVDLGSTNGTFVNQDKVFGTVSLKVGDALKIGSTVFAFLSEGEDSSSHTVSLSQDHSRTLSRTSSLFGLPPASAAHTGPTVRPPAADFEAEESGPTLLDWVRRIRLVWNLVKRYAWLLVTLGCLGLAGGVVFARMNPPPGTAWFEISLQSEARLNPMEDQPNQQQPVIFMAAQNAFKSLPQIQLTMRKLEYEDLSDAAASAIKENLGFNPLDRWRRVWRGEYRDASAEAAKSFLETHLDLYLKAEIDKTLQLIQARDQFLAKQLADAEKALTSLEGRMALFREKHPELLPLISDVELPAAVVKTGSSGRGGSARLVAVQAQIAALQKRISSGDSILDQRLKKTEKYRRQVAKLEAQIVQAKAKLLTDEHPKVVELRSQIAEVKRLEKQELAGESTTLEKRTNVDLRKMQQNLEQLKQTEAKLKGQIRRRPRSEEKKEKKEPEEKLSLVELEARYREMARDQTNAATLYQTLSTNKNANELQLEIERAAATSRYDIITPPTAEVPNARISMLKRVIVGGAAGLFLALLLAALLELRAAVRLAEQRVGT